MAIDKNAITKEAQKYAAKGQYDKAIAEWKKVVKESPNDPNLFNTIGDLCLKKDSKTEAVEAYKTGWRPSCRRRIHFKGHCSL